MKRSRALQLIVIVMLVLSFVVSPAAAQFEPQVGTVDEDGDLVAETLPMVETAAFDDTVLSSIGDFTEVNAAPAPSPEHPVDVILYTKTPQFFFTERSGATRYRIEVVNGYTSEVLYTYTGAPDCASGACSLKLQYALKYIDLNMNKGKYQWRVRAKVAGEWENYSDYAVFALISPGFTDTFDTGVGKWRALTGDWKQVDAGYLKTSGVKGIGVSALHKNYFLNFDYTVTMKRKLTDAYQGVIVWGDPTSYVPQNGLWNSGVFFLFRNNQTYAIFQMNDGALTQLQGYVFSPSIAGYDWNTLRVVAAKPNLHFYINDVYHGYVTPTIENEGFVGAIAYKNDNTLKEPLLIDSVMLVSSQPIFSSLQVNTSMKLDLEPLAVDGME